MDDYQKLYGVAPSVIASAPGRVNLIGEHTDYNGGYVLPIAIPQRTYVSLSPRRDKAVNIASANTDAGNLAEYLIGMENPTHTWLDYVQGVTWALGVAGQRVRGFDAWVSSEVPVGSGLSSSAALAVALLRALREAFKLQIDDVQIAKLGQQVENDFVGARVGIMDQMAASLADTAHALFLDTRDLSYQKVALPLAAELIVIDSGVRHDHASGEYNTRRRECEQAAELLEVGQLRELAVNDLQRINQLPEPLNRRARHVVMENQRVLDAVAAMRVGNLAMLGELFNQSHASLRDDYEVSAPALDLLVELGRKQVGIYGARMTGGGFGGSVVMLAAKGMGRNLGEYIAKLYTAHFDNRPQVIIPQLWP